MSFDWCYLECRVLKVSTFVDLWVASDLNIEAVSNYYKMGISANGTGSEGHNIIMKQQKRPRKLKITVIATILLSMYIIFIYLILITFGSGTANENNQEGNAIDTTGYRPPITSHLLRANKSSHQTSTSDAQIDNEQTDQSKTRELTLSDFCGLCHWRSQGFNCNERVDWVVKTKHQTPRLTQTHQL